MNRDLEQWLNWTWQNRDDIMDWARRSTHKTEHTHRYGFDRNKGIKLIYGYYIRALGGQATETVTAQEARNPNYNKFAGNLALAKLELGSATVSIQGGDTDVSASYLQALKTNDIAGKFFHFIREDMATTKRVYINLNPDLRGDTFRRILGRIWKVDGLDRAKVAGPGGHDRVDSLVIYCRDQAAQNEVVERLREYNVQNPGRFRRPLPATVKAAEGLIGIGCGAEPPEVQIWRQEGKTYFVKNGGQSFGAYRSEIIFTALEETLSSAGTSAINKISASPQAGRMPTNDQIKKRVFKVKALEFLLAGGVTSSAPAKQHAVTGTVAERRRRRQG